MADNTNKYPEGMFVDNPPTNAPSYLKAKVSVNVEKFLLWARQNVNAKGYINIDVKESKDGKLYLSVNTWQKPATETEGPVEAIDLPDDIKPEDLPF
jgi:hypothetical protein